MTRRNSQEQGWGHDATGSRMRRTRATTSIPHGATAADIRDRWAHDRYDPGRDYYRDGRGSSRYDGHDGHHRRHHPYRYGRDRRPHHPYRLRVIMTGDIVAIVDYPRLRDTGHDRGQDLPLQSHASA